METVCKTQLTYRGETQFINVHSSAEILCAQEQKGNLVLWYRCDPDRDVDGSKLLAICGTGHACPLRENARYICTVQEAAGDLEWHIFEYT
jgi:hypothetical protein